MSSFFQFVLTAQFYIPYFLAVQPSDSLGLPFIRLLNNKIFLMEVSC